MGPAKGLQSSETFTAALDVWSLGNSFPRNSLSLPLSTSPTTSGPGQQSQKTKPEPILTTNNRASRSFRSFRLGAQPKKLSSGRPHNSPVQPAAVFWSPPLSSPRVPPSSVTPQPSLKPPGLGQLWSSRTSSTLAASTPSSAASSPRLSTLPRAPARKHARRTSNSLACPWALNGQGSSAWNTPSSMLYFVPKRN
ncbi:hypothetical protein PtB15_2B852 [Puccinia triticina]|nr:hypothetical protein PtB15_2B852 [Puccinia triticina]